MCFENLTDEQVEKMLEELLAKGYTEDKAISYAKSMYAADNSIYADDRYNLWQIELL